MASSPSCQGGGSAHPGEGPGFRPWSLVADARARRPIKDAPPELHARSREDDLAAGGEVVELAHGDDVLDLADEVVPGETEKVHRCLARVQAGPGVRDHLDELGDRGNVELAHL